MNKMSKTRKEKLNQLMEVAYIPVESDYSLRRYEKISLSTMATEVLNAGAIAKTVKDIFETKKFPTTLYKIVEPVDVKGTLMFKNGVTFGNYCEEGTMKITNRAGFEAISSSTMSINPYILLITIAITMINKKLDSIKNLQMSILEYLKLQEEAKIKGNIKALQEISEEYRYNTDNEKYKVNKHILVQEIRRDSEQSIIFAKELIVRKMVETKKIHIDKNIVNKIEEVERIFKNYQLAVYQFSYSAFLEIMLLENFEPSYLNMIYEKIMEYIKSYKAMRKECLERLYNDFESSIESATIKVASTITKGIGKIVSKIPVVKEGQFDEKLLETSIKINKYNERRIDKNLDNFIQQQEDCALVFAHNIKIINTLFNEELNVLFDIENLYILPTKEQ